MILLLLLLSGCALLQPKPEIYPVNPLVKEILVPREGHAGLTNGNCAEYSGDSCTKFVIRDYDLANQDLRDQLNQFNFICKVGTRRYKVCLDKPGLCHITSKKDAWWKAAKPFEDDYIDQSNIQKLLNADTLCFSEDSYSYPDM